MPGVWPTSFKHSVAWPKKKKKRKIHKETKFSRLHNNTGQLHLHQVEMRSNLHHIICSTRTGKTSSMCQQQSQFFSVSWLPVHLSYFALPWNQHYRAQILRNSHWNKESFLKQKRQCNSHGLIWWKLAIQVTVKSTKWRKKCPKTVKIWKKLRIKEASQ